MPNRIIRESARTSPSLDLLSDFAERFFWRLTTIADDFGRFDANARVLLAAAFPLRVATMKPFRIEAALEELVSAGIVILYEVGARLYGYFVAWAKHQRIRNSVSKHPDPPEGAGQFASTFEQRAIPVELRQFIKYRDRLCLACGAREDLVVDHILAVKNGGTNDIGNLQVLCADCNGAKHTKALNFLNPGDEERAFAALRRDVPRTAATGRDVPRVAASRAGARPRSNRESKSDPKGAAEGAHAPMTGGSDRPDSFRGGAPSRVGETAEAILARWQDRGQEGIGHGPS